MEKLRLKNKELEKKFKVNETRKASKENCNPAIETHKVLEGGVHPSELVKKRDPSSRNASISKRQPISTLATTPDRHTKFMESRYYSSV